jgi:CRISPR-associated protein Cmr1
MEAVSSSAHLLIARFSLVTPMFLGGASHEAEAIRPPSLKGALRFWWRALNWREAQAAHPDDPAAALSELHKKEARLFGASADFAPVNGKKSQTGGQGVFLLAVKPEGKFLPWNPQGMGQSQHPGWIYLLGLGLCKYEKKKSQFDLTRQAFATGSFRVELRFRSNASPEDRLSVAEALRLFGLLGGLGAKTRRGWGSVALTQLCIGGEPQALPGNAAEYREAVLAFLQGAPADLPPFTAFSAQSQINLTHQANDALRLLESVGEDMLRFRSNGRVADSGGRRIMSETRQPSELRFWDDHELMFKALRGPVGKLPQRLVFGMPYSVQFSKNGGEIVMQKTANEKRENDEPDFERRASPLLIHLHPVSQGQFAAVQMFLPARYLPAGEKVVMARKFNGKSGGEVGQAEFQPDWQIIGQEYFDSLRQNERCPIRR